MKQSPLHASHLRNGAHMQSTGGWTLPHSFRSLLEEHMVARTACAVFDISHTRKLSIRGSGAQFWLENALRRRIADLRDGSCFTLPSETQEGFFLSACLLRESAGCFFIIGSTQMVRTVEDKLREKVSHAAVEIRDETEGWCGMALMGPRTGEVLGRVLRGVQLPFLGDFTRFYLQGEQLLIGRLALQGENEKEQSYEFFCPAVSGISWYESFIGAGAQPCGFATRELLRLERMQD